MEDGTHHVLEFLGELFPVRWAGFLSFYPLSLKVVDLRRYLATLLGETGDYYKRVVAIWKPGVQSLGYLVEFV